MKIPSIHKLSNCRICGAGNLQKFVQLPSMPFTDDFVNPKQKGQKFIADINIYVCEQCLTSQTLHNVEVEDYYEDYQYSVGDSVLAKTFMRTLAERLKSQYYPGSDGVKVLEIGSSDGEQLLAFKETGCRVLGYEPSSFLCEISETKGVPAIQGLFTDKSVEMLPKDFKEVDVVMLSYTFDHLPDPISFLNSTLSILNKKEGLLVVEIHNLEKIVERQEYCLFEHEHSIYLTEQTVVKICESVGLVVVDFDLIPEVERRANSLIFIATPCGSIFSDKVAKHRTPAEFSNLDFYRDIGKNIRNGILNLENFVEKMTSNNKKLIGYGAGGRGVMTLSAMTNAKKFTYILDKKPKSPGLLMPKTELPVYPLDYLVANPVDEILVFSFGYMKEIQEELLPFGYKPEQFHSLIDVLAGNY